jgi:hypothetical protein
MSQSLQRKKYVGKKNLFAVFAPLRETDYFTQFFHAKSQSSQRKKYVSIFVILSFGMIISEMLV